MNFLYAVLVSLFFCSYATNVASAESIATFEKIPSVPTKRCIANQTYICSNACIERGCDKLEFQSCKKDCQNGCYCAQGYGRDANGKCIALQDCPIKSQCPENSILTNPCKEKTCIIRPIIAKSINLKARTSIKIEPPTMEIPCIKECVPECTCIKPYFYNTKKGICDLWMTIDPYPGPILIDEPIFIDDPTPVKQII